MADTLAVPAPAAEASGGRKKILLVVGVALAAVLVGGMAAKMFLMSPAEGAAAEPAEPVLEEGEVVTIGQMTTSLKGAGTHYARVELAAVMEASQVASDVEPDFPLMRDRALSVIMEFTPKQLRTAEGADRLRAALTSAAQDVWEEDQVLRIVLTDLLVQ